MKCSSRVAVATLLASSLLAVSPMSAQAPTQLRSVVTASAGGTVTVVIEADGALPMPTPGSLEDPPRLFFDFPGVTPQRRGVITIPGAGSVRQARVALFSINVTRVVLDLVRREAYRIDANERTAGRIKIVVGSESTTARAVPSPPAVTPPKPPERTSPMPAAPPTPAPPTPVPAATPKTSPAATPEAPRAPSVAAPPPTPNPAPAPAPSEPTSARRRPPYTPPASAPKPPSREVERYRQRLSGALERLEAQQPIVMLIDAEGSISMEALQAALTEFTSVRRLLDGIKPSEALASAHELLLASCTLGATASKLGIEASHDRNVEARKNAASAAAGALMFFDRACADLGCARAQH